MADADDAIMTLFDDIATFLDSVLATIQASLDSPVSHFLTEEVEKA